METHTHYRKKLITFMDAIASEVHCLYNSGDFYSFTMICGWIETGWTVCDLHSSEI